MKITYFSNSDEKNVQIENSDQIPMKFDFVLEIVLRNDQTSFEKETIEYIRNFKKSDEILINLNKY